MEKVIQEFKVIETDDGFRIEVKGDKERMREFVHGMDPRRWAHRAKHAGRRGWCGFGPRMFFGFGAPPWMWEDAEEESDKEA